MPKVSVIIPVYNTEKYLHRCLDSVTNQTLEDIEIIIVDDGSLDNSPTICEEYAIKYSNIVFIHQKNKGLSASRNVGMAVATGEYIGFVDSDDYISPYMYEKLYQSSKEFDCTTAICNYQNVMNGEIINSGKLDFPTNRRVNHNEILKLMKTANERNILWFVWKSIYKRTVLSDNGIYFLEGNIIEDTPFNMEALLCSDGAVFIDEPLYFYEQSGSSLMRAKHKHNYLEKLENLYNEKMRILKKYNIDGYSDMYNYTMTHTLPLLFSNEINYKRKLSEKVLIYKKMRNSKMIIDAIKNVNPLCINSKLKYLALLLKYRCYFLLTLVTN